MANITDITGATRESIGRYFSLVSFIPSVLLVSYIFILLSSGAPYRAPDPTNVVRTVSHLTLADVAALTLVSVGIGVVLHPLQFAMVQFLEGYWGIGKVAQRARCARILWHWRRLEAVRTQSGEAESRLNFRPPAYQDHRLQDRIAIVSLGSEAERLSSGQPETFDQMMPTRLGNVLRYYESTVGLPYNLSAIRIMPYLARVAPTEDMDYVNDQRSNLDLAVRVSLVSVLAFILSVGILWRYGLWLLIALVPYALALLSYRGAVVAAREYGRSLAAVIALNRFALYERLHLPLPPGTAEERKMNKTLGLILNYSNTRSLKYEHSKSSEDSPGN